MDANNRVGRFSLHRDVVRGATPEQANAIFRDVVILDTRASLFTDSIEYFARGQAFDEVGQGEILPAYKPILHAVQFPDCTGYFVKWERVE